MAARPQLKRMLTPRLADREKYGKPPIHAYTWGRGDLGQLGLGDENDRSTPALVGDLADRDIIHVALGDCHAAFLTAEGELYTTGNNDSGQLGIGAQGSQLTPVRVAALESRTLTHVACGQAHTVAVTDSGSLVSWGAADSGQLGHKDTAAAISVPLPKVIKGSRDHRFARVACGAAHTVALTGSGEVFTFGQGAFGALGHGNSDNVTEPKHVEALWALGIVQVACGASHSAALTIDGQVFTWGRGKYGQLGHGSTQNETKPMVVRGLASQTVCQVACGGDHTLVLTDAGAVYSWGRGRWGQTGHDATTDIMYPRQVAALAGARVVHISAGARHSLAVTEDARVFVWGDSEQHQLGMAASQMSLLPTPMLGLPAEGRQQLLFAVAGGDACVAVYQQSNRHLQGAARDTSSPHTSLPRDGSLPNVPEAGPMEVDGREGHVVKRSPSSRAHIIELPAPPGAGGPKAGGAWQPLGALQQQPPPDASGSEPSDAGRAAAEGAAAAPPGNHKEHTAASPQGGAHEGRAAQSLGAGHPGLPPGAHGYGGAPGGGAGAPAEVKAAERRAAGENGTVTAGGGEEEKLRPLVGRRPMDTHGMGLQPLQLPDLPRLLEVARSTKQKSNIAQLNHAVEDVFSSPRFLVNDFREDTSGPGPDQGSGLKDEAPGFQGVEGPGLNLELIRTFYQHLLELYSAEVLENLASSIARLLTGLERFSKLGPMSVFIRALLVVWQCPLLGEIGVGDTLASKLFLVLNRLSVPAERRLEQWLTTYPKEILGGRFVRSLQHYITNRERVLGNPNLQRDLAHALKALDILYKANEEGGIVHFSEFYSTSISTHASLREEYLKWRQLVYQGGVKSLPQPPISYCQVAFVLTPEAKARIMQLEAAIEKSFAVQGALMLNASGNPQSIPVLLITVRRERIVEDAMGQLAAHHYDFKKPLKVKFEGEEAVDEGGVAKEFFQLLVRALFDVSFGMFTYDEETRSFWFNRNSLDSDQEFQLVGVILGLAIYNGVILDVHFPQVVYKKLMGQNPTLEDLRELQPVLARSLQTLLDFEGDVEATFSLNFQVEYEYFDAMRTHDLVPNGGNVAVTNQNRRRYVDAYVKYLLEDSIEAQFAPFSRGFRQVCGDLALNLFRYEELELLICGLPHFDFDALEKVAQYDGGYSRGSQIVRWFWELVRSMSLEEKKALLFFTTGNDRAPVGGLGSLKFIIVRHGLDTDRLPTSHTCFNVLMLPEYSSKAKLEQRLKLAIQNSTGFGLQ